MVIAEIRKMYLAKQYMEVYNSKYTTDEERKMLREDTFTVGAMPLVYHKSPGLVKAKIKRNKQILQQCNEEAKANKGKFSTKMPLER